MNAETMSELDSGHWAEHNPHRCPCRGGGWMRSDFDTVHACPLHGGEDAIHPDYFEAFDGPELDEAMTRATITERAHTLRIHREAYRFFQKQSNLSRRAFRVEVERIAFAASTLAEISRVEWVDAAEHVSEVHRADMLDAQARAEGYSCRLEAALAADAEIEGEARRRGMEPARYAPFGSPERADADRWY